MARKRIDRNNYDPGRVLEIVREQTDHDEQSPILGTDELLRLLGESAHAYLLLRRDALELWEAIQDASEFASDKTLLRRFGVR